MMAWLDHLRYFMTFYGLVFMGLVAFAWICCEVANSIGGPR